ncbi:MAG TPA: helix-turn-helix transcriptional regulator [Verrucomicrobiae bacterium]|nr:helix-turn-helix transcriptional regulator [Verrucomicrobiae bacterium]
MNNAAKSRNHARRPRQASGSALFSDQTWTEIARSLRLSPREAQILHGVFDDRTELAIAADLNISPHTVHSHVERLYHKLDVADRVGLILLVISEFLRLTAAPGSRLPPLCASRAAGLCPLHG